ncbi:thiamine diphosphokinase [Fructobacillus sp. M1-13]|uniref:Thiamine diphosphokinase n=1 Tax=Fructobacillus papyriferae TaxID=2713171 RepID=A0ABS5QPT9_9LACO|nr:thiamine diphosphokinase [Fructobacillus papyriferae]MBS9334490.1 thiamine diphosphokinase [Fructobacillus papyriferae]MCD2158479.1 thiamine diphosphokinase [Fructobacillus papyriferae]
MRINILAGGPKENWPADLFKKPGDWVGADRGALFLMEAGIEPLFAVGDFDSVSDDERQRLIAYQKEREMTIYPAHKDYTDTALAVRYAMAAGADDIVLYGATGGRLDHELSNLTIPLLDSFLPQDGFSSLVGRFSIVDCRNTISYLDAEHNVVEKLPGHHYLGFMPLGIVDNFSILDAEYPLTIKENSGIMYSSNEFIGELVHVSIDRGIVLVTQSTDRRS